MKKKIIGISVIAAIVLATAWNFNKNDVMFSDVSLDSVEALAGTEGCLNSVEVSPWGVCDYIIYVQYDCVDPTIYMNCNGDI